MARVGYEGGDMREQQHCPKCGEECQRDEVDVGVGIIYGPWGCPGCGWSSDPQYDHSEGGACKAQSENYPDAERYVDQFGDAHSKERMKENVQRFGIDPDVIDEVFP
jgi:hypothetical protein